MAKLTLTDITSGYGLTTTLNANNALIEAALENTLSRDGTGPNTMSVSIDMNSQRITNLPTAVNSSEPVTLGQIDADLLTTTNLATQANVATLLWPVTSQEGTAGVTPSNYAYEPGDVRRYGAVGDGSTDDSTAFSNAFAVAAVGGVDIKVPATTTYYKIASAITQATLSNPIKMVGSGRPEIRFVNATPVNYAFQITDTNGNDVHIEGIYFNGNNDVAVGMRVDNPSASMADANIGKVVFKDCRFENMYLTTGLTYAAAAVSVVGGFEEAVFEDCIVRSVDRDTGAGTPGTQGCVGFLVTFDDINAYVKKTTIRGGIIDTITNNETTGTGDDVDCDGVIISAPAASTNSNVRVPATCSIVGTNFVDCKGRCIKTQLDGFSMVRDVTIERGLEEAINNGRDINFQRGGGTISGVVMFFNETGASGSTMGASHACIAWEPDQPTWANQQTSGGLRVSDVIVYNSIATGTDVLPYFALITNDDATKELVTCSIKDCSVIGGQVARVVRHNAGSAQELYLNVEGFEGDITTDLIQFHTNSVDASSKIVANGNRNYGSGTPSLCTNADSSAPFFSAYNNTGFVLDYTGDANGSNQMGEQFRARSIGGDATEGHVFATAQTVTLADDASHTFENVGAYGIGIITNNFGDTTQTIFAHDGNSFVEVYQGGATSANVTFGTTTNPDIDGDLNIWTASSGVISIKNRLGSSRTFHLFHFGGD